MRLSLYSPTLLRRLTLCLLTLTAWWGTAPAQPTTTALTPAHAVEQLFAHFKAASRFDHNYSREHVYLHMDNTSYLEGDTLWFKAYVVRASSLLPTRLSKVLYVDLLTAEGQLAQRRTLAIDSLGQAEGCFDLNLPLRSGYYEVRAYTRAMTNWGAEACFSRVVPVFGHSNPLHNGPIGSDITALSLPRPTPTRRPTLACPRPYELGSKSDVRLTFYPEGGERAKDVDQVVAYELTDGQGHALDDIVSFYNKAGRLLCESMPLHLGRGTAMLPAEAAYAVVRRDGANGQSHRYNLPTPSADYCLRLTPEPDGVEVCLAASREAGKRPQVVGLAMFNREQVTYFDTVTVGAEPVVFFLEAKTFREGVNRMELFTAEGHGLATRFVWGDLHSLAQRQVEVSVVQNEEAYGLFEPAVVKLHLSDSEGRPVSTTCSVAVRDAEGNITETHDGGLAADLLLASELRGYIHRPDLYFESNDARHRRMLDLLLLVQGWRSNTFDVMCGVDTFHLTQPIEERLLLKGRLVRDNDKMEPLPHYHIGFKAYSTAGHTLEGTARTDAEGWFALESHVNFEGEYIAQFTTRNEEGKKRWSRLLLDRWFAPGPAAFRGRELDLHLTEAPDSAALAEEEARTPTFEWTDTLPNINLTSLATAEVKAKRSYRGFTGNRYTYDGGETKGMRRATRYYNIHQEADRMRDRGEEPGEVFSFLARLEQTAATDRHSADDDPAAGTPDLTTTPGAPTDENTAAPTDDFFDEGFVESLQLKGRRMKVYINNTPYDDLVSRFPELYSNMDADEFKACAIVEEGLSHDAVSGRQVDRSRARYSVYLYEDPEGFRLRDSRGVDRRTIEGFTPAVKFYSPNYRAFDTPTASDRRRTLCWAPQVTTDKEGNASLLFFTNSRPYQRLDISIRGLTPKGLIISYR